MSHSLSRLIPAVLVVSLALVPGTALAEKNDKPKIDPWTEACMAAFNFCLAACKINDEHNNTGGYGGLPLLSFAKDCSDKCFDDLNRCQSPPRQSAIRPGHVLSFESASPSDSNGGDNTDHDGFNRGDVMSPNVFDAPAAFSTSGSGDLQ